MHLQTNSLLLIAAIVMVVTVLPVYLAARFVNAERATLGWCALAVPVATAGAWLGYQLIGAFFGLLTGFIGMVIGFWIVLRPSMGGAFGMTVFAFILQLALVQFLFKLFGS
ncbi:MAG: hypothetical protein ACK4E7_05505 [Permianibacter sp.]